MMTLVKLKIWLKNTPNKVIELEQQYRNWLKRNSK